MTLVITLLTFFLGGQPATTAVPPQPTGTTQTAAYEEEFETTDAQNDTFGMPRITPPTWCSSPSFMVAASPVPPGTPFDVFSPAVRPPHDFPTLYPCGEVKLIPCPAPLPSLEPPAVRHVSFMGEGAEFRIAQCDAQCETGACPLPGQRGSQIGNAAFDPHWLQPGLPGMVFAHRLFGPALAAPCLWEQLHARQHAPPFHPVTVFNPSQDCPTVGLAGICPAGFGGPMDAPNAPFPGAKSVKHTVSATYDVPHQTAHALEGILESGTGVLSCTVQGDELTVNATPQAQMAIAQFLSTVVTQPASNGKPSKTISIRYTTTKACTGECSATKSCTSECSTTKACTGECSATKACTSECSTTKACTGECSATKACTSECSTTKACTGECSATKACTSECSTAKCCQGQCGEKCGCSCGKTETSEPSAAKASDSKVFSCYVGFEDRNTCPPTPRHLVSVEHKPASQPRPVVVKIQATKEGVVLQTSDGTQIRAQSLQIETNRLGKVECHHADAVLASPQTPTYPVYGTPVYVDPHQVPSAKATPYPAPKKAKPAATAPVNSLPTY